MADWWAGLSVFQQIYYCVAIPSSVILLIQTVLAFFGMGGDSGDVHDGSGADTHLDDVHMEHADGHDADGYMHHEAGMADFRFFTVRGIFAFLVIFGWVGVAMLAGKASLILTVIISVICGFAAMLLIGLMFYGINRMQESGNINYRKGVGKKAEVYLFIPPQRKGKGKIQIELQERLIEADAVTDDEKMIKTGSQVEICGLYGENTFVVKRVSSAKVNAD